ncbi:flagellar basal body rod modification protein [Campylobacter jejuni]|nr:flagellar basal body rod modification protein [Campylobacter jejuni]
MAVGAVNNSSSDLLNSLNNQNQNTKATSNTDTVVQNNNGIVSNPGAELDKDAFLQLLLVELQHQDPTDPMDTDKMLTQTSQLAALEMQQNTNTTMQAMVATMEKLNASIGSGMSMQVLAAVGKLASVENNYVELKTADEVVYLKMYLPEKPKEGEAVEFKIYDENNNLVKTLTVDKGLDKGLYNLAWDGRNDNGAFAGAGKYTIKAEYTNESGGTSKTSYGSYPIEAIKFIDGVPYAKMGGQYVLFDDIAEIIDPSIPSSGDPEDPEDPEKPDNSLPEVPERPDEKPEE